MSPRDMYPACESCFSKSLMTVTAGNR